ncbi:MAG: hypothetical protein ABFC84_04490 [Veillonellales bacterium]
MNRNETVRSVGLAALLHDVGGICYRAGDSSQEHSILGKKFM